MLMMSLLSRTPANVMLLGFLFAWACGTLSAVKGRELNFARVRLDLPADLPGEGGDSGGSSKLTVTEMNNVQLLEESWGLLFANAAEGLGYEDIQAILS